MKKILLKCVTFIFMCLLATNSFAELIDNGDVTTDSDSGLDWLDLTISSGRSFSDVSTQFGSNGDFEGWRYANISEVKQLLINAGADINFITALSNESGANMWAPENNGVVAPLLQLWGETEVSLDNTSGIIVLEPWYEYTQQLHRK